MIPARKARYVGYESAHVTYTVDRKYWRANVFGNLKNLRPKLLNKYNNHNLKYLKKGRYIFVTYRIVPYRWAKNSQENYRPIEYAFIEIN